MKKRTLETVCFEEKDSVGGRIGKRVMLGTASLLALFAAQSKGLAESKCDIVDEVKVTEVTQPGTEVDEKKDTITLEKAIQQMKEEGAYVVGEEDGPGIEPDPDPQSEGGDEGELEGEKVSQEPRIGVHGFIQVGTSVVPDFAGIFSDKVSGMVAIDAKHQKTGLGLTVIRLDDFHTDPEYPLSRASVVVPSWTIQSKDGKRTAGASVEFSFIDQMPGTVGYTPVVVGTYSADGWTFEGKYFHDIREGEDMDAVRLGITKKIGDILSLTAQGWYKSDYEGKVFGRVIADVDLGDGFGAQLSCIVRDGKLTPTMGVMYRF